MKPNYRVFYLIREYVHIAEMYTKEILEKHIRTCNEEGYPFAAYVRSTDDIWYIYDHQNYHKISKALSEGKLKL